MAYEIISAIGKVKQSQAQWEEVDLKKYTLSILYKRYSTIRATLRNPFLKKEGSVIVDDFIYEVEEGKTFLEYLESIGEKALNLGNLSTKITKKGLLYREALSNKFKVLPVKRGQNPDDNFSLKHEYSDLFITKEGVDPIDLYKHSLITVNGYVHATDASAKGLWVTGGYDTIKKRKKQCIGVISFENIGEVKQIPIKEDMISKLNDQIRLYDECVIDIGEDCSNKTILLVLGGYLHVLDYDVFTQISDTAIKIKLKNTPLLERIHQSFEDLNIDDSIFDERYGKTNLKLEEIHSDKFLKKYLSSDFTFIVLLDNPEVFKDITYPQQRDIPNNYLTNYKPVLPMRTRLGKFEEYVFIKDVDTYVLETADCQYHPRLYNRSLPLDENSYYNDARRPTDRRRIPTAYFFNLITFLGK